MPLFKEPDALERRLKRNILRRYRRLARDLRTTVRKIEGELGDQSSALAAQRTRALLEQAEAAISDYAAAVAPAVQEATGEAVRRGAKEGEKALAALGTAFNRLPREALAVLARKLVPGEPLYRLFAEFGPQARQAAERTIFVGLATGKSPRTIAKELREDLGVPRHRALLIASDQINSAAREASIETFRQNAGVVVGWRWVASRSERTCAMCLAMDGTVHSLEEGLHSHPACRCVAVPIVRSQQDKPYETGKEWLGKQPKETRRAILGRTKQQLIDSGQIELEDLVVKTHSPVWGPGRREASLKELVSSGKLSNQQIALASSSTGGGGGSIPPVIPGGGGGGGPAGGGNPLVSAAISITRGRGRAEVQRSLDAIDGVHADGLLPGATWQFVVMAAEDQGAFLPTLFGGPRFATNVFSKAKRLTAAHEIGHFLDFEAFSTDGNSCVENAAEFAAWRRAILRTPEYAALQARVDDIDARASAAGFISFQELNLLEYVRDYVLTWHEMWARSYAQYIAVESGDTAMLGTLNRIRARKGYPLYPEERHEQWDAASFGPVRDEIDRIFRQRGWR